MSAVTETQSSTAQSLTIFKRIKNNIVNIAKKIATFINENKSLIFFGLTIYFSYYVTSVSALEYFSNISLIETFIQGALVGAIWGAVKNMFSSKALSKEQDDNINYFAGLFNLGVTYLYPQQSFITTVSIAGFVVVKSIFNKLAPSGSEKKTDEQEKIQLWIPEDAKESALLKLKSDKK